MENKKISIQKVYESEYELAQGYFRVVLGTLGIHFTKKQLELLAFISVRGNILTTKSRKDFIKMYKSSQATINNTLVQLKKLGIIIKNNGKNCINSSLFGGLRDTMHFNIVLKNGTKKENG